MRLAHGLAAELQALRDAETVLLVDDREPQARQQDLVLEQRVRADREHRVAARDRRERLLPRLGRQAAGQPRELDGQAVEPMRELAEVLLGQDFGGRHERDLPSGLDRLQRGQRRDDRLAAADVALQQALHRHRALQVVADLAPDALLRPRQLERDAPEKRPGQRAGAGQHRRAPGRSRFPVRLQRELLRDQLVELEARPRRMRALVERMLREPGQPRRRRVQKAHGVGESPQVAARDEPVRQRLGDERGVGGERARDDLAQGLLRESGRRRVNRGEAVRQRRTRLDHLELRVDDLAAEVSVAHLAEDAQAPARRERLLLARIEMKEAQHELRARAAVVAVLQKTDQLSPRPVADVGVDDRALGLLREARLQRGERHDRRVVLVAQRQVQHEILVAGEAETRELIVEAAPRRFRLRCRRFPGRDEVRDGAGNLGQGLLRSGLRGLAHGSGHGTVACRTPAAPMP